MYRLIKCSGRSAEGVRPPNVVRTCFGGNLVVRALEVREATALALCFLMAMPAPALLACTGSLNSTVESAQAPAAAIVEPVHASESELALAAIKGAPAVSRDELADRLEYTLDALQRSADRLPRDSFEPDEIVRLAGTDPLKLLQMGARRDQVGALPGSAARRCWSLDGPFGQ